MKKTLVLGYFGFSTDKFDGQRSKTREVYRLFQEQVNGEVYYFDTECFKYNKLLVFNMFREIAYSDTLVYLPAHNNLKYLFPFIFVISFICRVKIHYFVIGGWLREFLKDLPFHRFLLKHVQGIYVETLCMKNELKEFFKFNNVIQFPNFRFFEYTPTLSTHTQLRLVFMARINIKKGLDWVFELASFIQKNNLTDKYTITFFGPINDLDRLYFEQNISKYSFVEYKGILQPDKIHETLSQFDVLLLPTHYYTEGLPGSVVDAYISGLPVIVSEWKHATEFVEDGKSGFIVPFEDGEELFIKRVTQLEANRDKLMSMKSYAAKKSKEFSAPELISFLEI